MASMLLWMVAVLLLAAAWLASILAAVVFVLSKQPKLSIPDHLKAKYASTPIMNGRVAANIEGDFVVFIIGLHIKSLWHIRELMPVFGGERGQGSVPEMVEELEKDPDSGYLGGYSFFGAPFVTVQYWRSVDHLMAYSRGRGGVHMRRWMDYVRSRPNIASKAGIFHETFKVRVGEYEAIYDNMPAFGLPLFGGYEDAVGRKTTAKGRLNMTDGTDAVVFDDEAANTDDSAKKVA